MTERYVVLSHGKDSEPWGSKIAAMADVRASDDTLIIARTDARGAHGGSMEEARTVEGARDEAKRGVADAGLLLHHDDLMGKTCTHTTVFLGDAHAQQPQFARLFPDRAVHVVLTAKAFGMGGNFVLEKTAGCIPKHVELFSHPG